MFEKIVMFLIEKFASLGLLSTFFMTFGLTVFEVKYFQLSGTEEIILFFFFTFFIVFFIFLLIAKIFELSRENPTKGEKDE